MAGDSSRVLSLLLGSEVPGLGEGRNEMSETQNVYQMPLWGSQPYGAGGQADRWRLDARLLGGSSYNLQTIRKNLWGAVAHTCNPSTLGG